MDQQHSEQQPNASKFALRRWALGTLFGLLVMLGLVAALVIVVDPFQHYRKASFYTPLVDRSLQRYINVGMARNYTYDTLSLGSSMTENTRTSDLERVLGGTALQLPFRGASLSELGLAMGNALGSRELKRVLIHIDDVNYTDSPNTALNSLPQYLYDGNPFTDIYYWFNLDVLARLPELYEYNRYALGRPEELDLDMLYNWTEAVMYGKARVFGSYRQWNRAKTPPMPIERIMPYVEQNLQQHLLPYIEGYPDTEFIIIYTPYSTLQWYNTYLFGQEDRVLYGRAEFARVLLPYPNVRLFDFHVNEDWATDYERYTDFTHYHGDINTEIIEAIGRGEYEVFSAEEVLANNEVIRGFMRDFVPPTPEEVAVYREESNRQVQERLQWQ